MFTGPYDLDPHGFHLFRRCVECPDDPPDCPECKSDETCSLLAQTCGQCADTTCVKIGSLPGQLTQKNVTPVGAIVGGVLAGVVIIALLLFFGHRFWFRKQRRAGVVLWDPPEKRDQSTLHRGQRQSTRSAHSIASTVQTRASNVIQIAFIPGVTARSPNTPDMGTPPMPGFPGSVGSNSATTSPHLEQHFFMPGDLRDSTWSDTSSFDPRISLTPSLARQSVATTIYQSDAIVPPIPAQQAYRAQANVVSVKNGTALPPLPATALPLSTPPKASSPAIVSGSSIVAKHVMARPIEIKKSGPAPRVPTAANLSRISGKKSNLSIVADANHMPFYSDEKEVVTMPPSGTTELATLPSPRSQPALVTLSEAQSLPSTGSSNTNQTNLDVMIADALNKAAKEPKHTGLGARPSRPEFHQRRDSGPFSDKNEVRDHLP